MLGCPSANSLGFSPSLSLAGNPHHGGRASIQDQIVWGCVVSQSAVWSPELVRVLQASLCRPVRHENSEPGLKGHFINASEIWKT